MPPHNEVAERMNRTLIEKARSMLSGARLQHQLWVVIVYVACYLVNWSTTSTLVRKTFYEVWIGKKPSLIHLKVFGCDSFVHVPKEKRSKPYNKAKKHIFISYKDGVKGYKPWNPGIRKTIYSQDVIFREAKSTSRNEDVPREGELEKLELEMKNEGFY